jgi:hypothetical protein
MKTEGTTGLRSVVTEGFSTVYVGVGGGTGVWLRSVGLFTIDVNVGGATTEVGSGGLEVIITAGWELETEVQVYSTDSFVGVVGVGQSAICRTTKVTTRSDGNTVGTINVPIIRCDT